MVIKFTEFLNEAKKDKKVLIDTLTDLLTKKPSVKLTGTTQKDIYSIAGIIQYFKDNGMSQQNANDAIYTYQNDRELKKNLKHVSIKDFKNGGSYPFYYLNISDSDVKALKDKIEKDGKEKAAPLIAKKEEMKKKIIAATKERKTAKKPSTRAKATTKSVKRK